MKIDGMPGEYAFKALLPFKSISWPRLEGQPPNLVGYKLSDIYYFEKPKNEEVIWPVEVDEHGVVYIPDPSEYEVKNEDK